MGVRPARLGFLVPPGNPTTETEVIRMTPPTATVHFTRMVAHGETGSLQGQVIPGGAPNNPLKARWLGIADGVGIHGTSEDWSIGSRASHGCIRMHVADVEDLYPRIPVGTKVLIK